MSRDSKLKKDGERIRSPAFRTGQLAAA
jgi:hypothetical protein